MLKIDKGIPIPAHNKGPKPRQAHQRGDGGEAPAPCGIRAGGHSAPPVWVSIPSTGT